MSLSMKFDPYLESVLVELAENEKSSIEDVLIRAVNDYKYNNLRDFVLSRRFTS